MANKQHWLDTTQYFENVFFKINNFSRFQSNLFIFLYFNWHQDPYRDGYRNILAIASLCKNLTLFGEFKCFLILFYNFKWLPNFLVHCIFFRILFFFSFNFYIIFVIVFMLIGVSVCAFIVHKLMLQFSNHALQLCVS